MDTIVKRPDSSNIASVSYDKATKQLFVSFKNGGVYRYGKVPEDVYTGISTGESAGKAFHQLVKKRGFPYQKIAEVEDKVVLDPWRAGVGALGGKMLYDYGEKKMRESMTPTVQTTRDVFKSQGMRGAAKDVMSRLRLRAETINELRNNPAKLQQMKNLKWQLPLLMGMMSLPKHKLVERD